MGQMVSFECPDSIFKRLDAVAASSGLNRSELCREGLREVLRHYDTIESDTEQQPSIRYLLQKLVAELQSNK